MAAKALSKVLSPSERRRSPTINLHSDMTASPLEVAYATTILPIIASCPSPQ